VASKGPSGYRLPRHRVPHNSRDEESKCVSMTWREISARPYQRGVDALQELREHLHLHVIRRRLVDPTPLIGPRGNSSPRHKMSCNSRDKGSRIESALDDVAGNIRQALRYHLTQETRVQNALDDVASNIRPVLPTRTQTLGSLNPTPAVPPPCCSGAN